MLAGRYDLRVGRSSTSSTSLPWWYLAGARNKRMRTLSRDELKRMMDDEEDFVLIDARTHEGFEDGHLPGAVKIPSNLLGAQAVSNFEKDRTIVTYCSGPSCESSTIAAQKLEKFGFANVLDFKGGLEEWKKAGYPLEKS